VTLRGLETVLAPALSVEVAGGRPYTARGRAGLPAIVRPAAARYTENLRLVLSGSSCASRDRPVTQRGTFAGERPLYSSTRCTDGEERARLQRSIGPAGGRSAVVELDSDTGAASAWI
jgi:hypothetical protein